MTATESGTVVRPLEFLQSAFALIDEVVGEPCGAGFRLEGISGERVVFTCSKGKFAGQEVMLQIERNDEGAKLIAFNLRTAKTTRSMKPDHVSNPANVATVETFLTQSLPEIGQDTLLRSLRSESVVGIS